MPQVFLDTSIQIDRAFEGGLADNRQAIEALMASYNFKATCAFGRVAVHRVGLLFANHDTTLL
jgi:hypothetical protein